MVISRVPRHPPLLEREQVLGHLELRARAGFVAASTSADPKTALRSYRELASGQREAFVRRLREGFEVVHHELIHAMVPRQRILAERGFYAFDNSDIQGIREAFVETAARRGFMPFMRDCGALHLEWRLGQGHRLTEVYPAHVAAMETLLDHLDVQGTSHAQVVHDVIRLGTSRLAMEHVCDLLLGATAKEDVHGRYNLWQDVMGGFSQLTRDLEELNQAAADGQGRRVAELHKKPVGSGPDLARDVIGNAAARVQSWREHRQKYPQPPLRASVHSPRVQAQID